MQRSTKLLTQIHPQNEREREWECPKAGCYSREVLLLNWRSTVGAVWSIEKTGFHHFQCDQIWRFFGIWATFQSLWQQLICPNILHSYTIFCKGVKIFHFSSEIIFGQLLQTFGNFLLVTLVFGKIKALWLVIRIVCVQKIFNWHKFMLTFIL